MSYTTIKTCTSSSIPVNPNVGDILFNTDTKSLIIKDELGWKEKAYDSTHNVSENSLSIQWFEKDQEGDLVLRNGLLESSSPAIEFWEAINNADYTPRESDYETDELGIQYFEDINGDVTPRNDAI